MGEWTSFPLKDFIEPGRSICYGIVQPGDHDPVGVPIVRVNNFNGQSLDLSEPLKVSSEIEKNYSRSRLQGGELLVTLVGSMGQTAIAPRSMRGWNVARAVGVIPLSERADARWIDFVLRSEPSQEFMAARANTTVQATFNLRDLAQVPIPMPPDEVRIPASSLLAALDDKIDLNRRMNATLEAMAQAIFRDWFVDFGPTRRKLEGATDPVAIMGNLIPNPTRAAQLAALFPDAFGDDGLPVGWEEQSLLDQAHWVNGAAYKNMHFVDQSNGLPVIKIAELKSGVTSQTKFTNTDLGERYRISDGELLFSWSGNPDTSIDAFLWTGGTAWLNQHIFAVRENGKRSKAELFVLLKWLMPTFADIARDKQTTGLGHVTKEDMKRLQICAPSSEIRQQFANLITPIFERIVCGIKENQTLAETRDYLLPRLMSGKVRVADAERMVG
jgi:type I restriction enzyme, S subunit